MKRVLAAITLLVIASLPAHAASYADCNLDFSKTEDGDAVPRFVDFSEDGDWRLEVEGAKTKKGDRAFEGKTLDGMEIRGGYRIEVTDHLDQTYRMDFKHFQCDDKGYGTMTLKKTWTDSDNGKTSEWAGEYVCRCGLD